MEAVISTLLAKRGAGEVVAIDAINYTRKVRLVQDLHGVYFDYYPDVQLDTIPQFIRHRQRLERGSRPEIYEYRSDVTVIAGLLYHVFSPLHLIACARSITRQGGIVVIETAAMRKDDFNMQYNFDGQRYIYGWTDTWFPSLPLLDYMLRLCKLQPLDAIWLENPIYPDLIRVGIACRAIPEVIAEPNETIMAQSANGLDHNIFVDICGDSSKKPPVDFTRQPEELVLRADGVTCDVYKTAMKRAAYRPGPDELCLRLDAKY
jgi:hypothetical protein